MEHSPFGSHEREASIADRTPRTRTKASKAAAGQSLVSATGSTSEGLPLSFNRAPCPELQPWVARIGVTAVRLPEDASLECGTFTEHPALRMIYGARWTAQTADGETIYEPGERGLALYFGPCSKMTRLKVHGSFRVVSIYFTPGATRGLDLPPLEETIDRIYTRDCFTGEDLPDAAFSPQDDVHEWLAAAEQQLLHEVRKAGLDEPNALLSAFETLCLTNPSASLDEFAHEHGIARRTLERTIRRNFGVSPRFALRRARALDMAATLLKVASKDEEAEMALRYFDQSHLTREMRQLFHTTPGHLRKGRHPLLLITMEIRQSRRLDMLARMSHNQPKPWRDPDAEPASRVNRTES